MEQLNGMTAEWQLTGEDETFADAELRGADTTVTTSGNDDGAKPAAGARKKNLLLIINPVSGTKTAAKYLAEISALFHSYGVRTLLCVTEKSGDATRFVLESGREADIICCIGGDGTLNETIAGIKQAGLDVPVGYIPAGSTNDFATSLRLSPDIMTAAKDVMEGDIVTLDIGRFNDRYFSYVASFGAFTRVSYATPQAAKNAFGHLAYVVNGILDIGSLRPYEARVVADGVTYEGEFLFASISNSTSIGGLLKLPQSEVDMQDGYFELMLVRKPADAYDMQDLLGALATKNYHCNAIEFVRAKHIEVYADPDTDWSLDGEYEAGCEKVTVENIPAAIRYILPKKN
ncbi:MAG: diacylglycerol kinase family lipid kinase [Clostridia bacterium]|nr:diacylglycerol kinase family lipid kinase [Clostridia bacterium]